MEHFWIPASGLVVAYLLDLVLGDPRWLPHPVRIMGKVTVVLERLLRTYFKGAGLEKVAGLLLLLLVGGGAYFVTFFIVYGASRLHLLLGFALSIYILAAMIAVTDMVKHVRAVLNALEQQNLPLARKQVSLLVSRDTAALDEQGVVRAALESLFENTADGVVAPLFYAALGGPALAAFYKAVNTLDSMVGYKNERYLYLGWASARADDLLNFIPARLTALIYIFAGVLSGLDWRGGWRAVLRDHRKHESPNSAWPETAAAGVTGLQLGGIDYYQGQEIKRPLLNVEAGRLPGRADLIGALALFRQVSLIAFSGACIITFVLYFLAEVFR